MNDIASRTSRPASSLVRAFLALAALALLLGLTMMNAGAAVDLVRFEAKWQNDGTVLVVWETSSELDSTAFFVYRSDSPTGPWTDYVDFEPAAGNEFTGATYSFVDTEVVQGTTYYYRLEETAADGSSNFYGPITTEGPGTTTATATSTRSSSTTQDVPATATRQYTNTPTPAISGTVSPTQTSLPTRTVTPARAVSTRALTPLVTTPTPIGGIVPTSAAITPTYTATATPEAKQIQATATETPTAPVAQETPSPTAQQLAAVSKETSQPLLDSSATQPTPVAVADAPQSSAASSRLPLFMGGGALLAAAALGVIALLIWRWRAG
jgi:hypothetical protein